MKICYISTKSIHTRRWVKYFAEKGHEVHLITPEYDNIKGVKTYEVNPKASKLSPLFKAIMIRNLVKNIKPDILHVHQVVPFGLYGVLSGSHPFVVSAWGSDVLTFPKSNISKWLVRFVLNKADLITCDGENSKEAMINLGEDSQKIKIVYHGVDTKKFSSEQKDKELIKILFDKEDFPTIISTRSLKPVYDVETLINAIPLVLKVIPDAKFIIAGEGEQKEYVMNLAKSLNVFHATRFVGQILHDELPKYLSSSDVYISTSLSDGGIAVSTLEAMAYGLPCIVTDVGDNNKWIKNNENGFIILTKNSKTLAEKVIYLLKYEDVRKKLGDANRKIIEEKADYYSEMGKVEKLYIELIKRYKT